MSKTKCKLCQSIIEPIENSIVICKCGEITLEGLKKMVVCATDTENYLEVDDNGYEIITEIAKPLKDDLLKMLDEMIKNIENLPNAAMITSINHYDFASALLLISQILKSQ